MSDQTTPTAYPEVTLGMELHESEPFLGVVAIDTWEDGQRGPQWHLGIKPVDRVIHGATGCLHNWCNYSEKSRSKMGILLKHTLAIFPDRTLKVGRGDLLGKAAWFETKKFSFGEDKETGEPIEVEMHVPIRAASDADAARAEGTGPAPLVAAPADFTPDQIAQILAVIEGKGGRALVKAAIQSDLPGDLKSAITSGVAVQFLEDRHLIEHDAEGNVRRLTGVAS